MHRSDDCIEVVPSALIILLTVLFFVIIDVLLTRASQNTESTLYKLLFAAFNSESKSGYTSAISAHKEINGNDCLYKQSDYVTSTNANGRPNGNANAKTNGNTVSSQQKSNPKRLWKIQNILLSEIHSVFSGLLAILSVYLQPAMLEDVVGTCTPMALSLICFSLGYFVHDCIHMLRRKLTTETIELLLHHFIIFITYGLAVVQRTYVAFAVISLFMEVNSIFLHSRQLANLRLANRESIGYRLLSVSNVVSFLAFRGLTTSWMVRWLWSSYDQLPKPVAALGATGLLIISVMNSVLFARLVKSDFFSPIKPPVASASNGTGRKKDL